MLYLHHLLSNRPKTGYKLVKIYLNAKVSQQFSNVFFFHVKDILIIMFYVLAQLVIICRKSVLIMLFILTL